MIECGLTAEELAPGSAITYTRMETSFENLGDASSGVPCGRASEEDDEPPNWCGSPDSSVDDEPLSCGIPDSGFKPTKLLVAELEQGLTDKDKEQLLELAEVANLRHGI